jgi:hypothetical protein
MTNWQTLFLLTLATGASVGIWIAIVRLPPGKQIQQALLLLVVFACAYFGARFAYVCFEASSLPQSIMDAVDYRSGGLSVFGAIWGAVIGFLLACGVQQRQLAATLDEIACMILPMGTFILVARWLIDAALYRNYSPEMSAYLPQFILPVSTLKPPDFLLLAAALLVVLSWGLERHKSVLLFSGMKGNVAFTVLVLFLVGMESCYGFFRLRPGYPYFMAATVLLPLFSWILWFTLGRKGEAH